MSSEETIEVSILPMTRHVISREGVVITTTPNSFSVVCQFNAEIWEQQAVQEFKKWIRERKERLNPFDE